MHDLKIEEIAERVVEAIMAEPVFNKKALIKVTLPALKVWLKKTDTPKKTGNVSKDKYLFTIAKRGVEVQYWKKVVRGFAGGEKMQVHYERLAAEVEAAGLNHFKTEE